MRYLAIAIGMSALLGGCAMNEAYPSGEPTVSAGALRGMEVAVLRCSGCHSIGGQEVSPRSNAPPFQQLRLRFNQITWERAMAEIAIGGHDEMPPVALDSADIRDLRTFIEASR